MTLQGDIDQMRIELTDLQERVSGGTISTKKYQHYDTRYPESGGEEIVVVETRDIATIVSELNKKLGGI
jgi:hypothetical protein